MSTREPLTNKQFAAIVWKRATEMTEWALNDGQRVCFYRSDCGPCLVGAAIPDDEYSDVLEGKGADILIYEGLVPALRHVDYDFANAVQECHDGLALKGHRRMPFDRDSLLNSLSAVFEEFGFIPPLGE